MTHMSCWLESTWFDVLLQEEWVPVLIPNMSQSTQSKDFSLLYKMDKVLEYHLSEREKKVAEFISLLGNDQHQHYIYIYISTHYYYYYYSL
jgi:hypothetical protein